MAEIPGVGMLTATALVATMGEAKSIQVGAGVRRFLGLVPRQSGTGGKVRLLGISKRGDTYLRTLLIHGRTVMFKAKDKGHGEAMLKSDAAQCGDRRVGQQDGTTAWAILAHGREYQRVTSA